MFVRDCCSVCLAAGVKDKPIGQLVKLNTGKTLVLLHHIEKIIIAIFNLNSTFV